jgi:hypothetical protein
MQTNNGVTARLAWYDRNPIFMYDTDYIYMNTVSDEVSVFGSYQVPANKKAIILDLGYDISVLSIADTDNNVRIRLYQDTNSPPTTLKWNRYIATQPSLSIHQNRLVDGLILDAGEAIKLSAYAESGPPDCHATVFGCIAEFDA